MYTQAMDTMGKDREDAPKPVRSADEVAQQAALRGAHRAGETIEPKDWMPERYRKQLIRMMSQHAHSEIVGMLPEGNWITRAPTLRRKMVLLAKVQDEAGHGLYIYCGTETLGVDRATSWSSSCSRARRSTRASSTIPTLTWADIGRDRLVRRRRGDREPDDARQGVVRSVRARDDPHLQGRELPQAAGLRDHARRWRRARRRRRRWCRTRSNRWWWPSLMMFGPHDKDSPNSEELIRWGVKRKSNDELRQRFVDLTVAQAKAIDLDAARSAICAKRRSARHWEFGAIDWDEFWRVVEGQRPVQPRAPRRARARRTTKARGCATAAATPQGRGQRTRRRTAA